MTLLFGAPTTSTSVHLLEAESCLDLLKEPEANNKIPQKIPALGTFIYPVRKK